jgi:hypothetical protein
VAWERLHEAGADNGVEIDADKLFQRLGRRRKVRDRRMALPAISFLTRALQSSLSSLPSSDVHAIWLEERQTSSWSALQQNFDITCPSGGRTSF